MIITNEEEYKKAVDRWGDIEFILSQNEDLSSDERVTLSKEQLKLEVEIDNCPFTFDNDNNAVRKEV
jgi:hypothetical protein